jgi:opacity protein-like surface antigen
MKHVLAAAALTVATALAGQAAAQPAPPPSPPLSGPPPVGQPGAFPPPPPLMWLPGAYIRGDGGYGFSAETRFRDLNDEDFNATLGDDVRIKGDSGSSPFYNLGVGGRFNRFLRIDVTASYLPSLKFSG